MTGHHFTIFDTAIGRCGVVWSERGIISVQLPMGDEKKTRARLQQRHDDLIETPPPSSVQSAIAGGLADIEIGHVIAVNVKGLHGGS